MSIVLVIIGFIVGGVLVGQNLIRAAAVRATISQIEKYNTAVNAFRGKYDCLPGDCAAAASFGFAPRGQYAGEGDGNGVIEGVLTNAAGQNIGTAESAGETAMFWVDLSAAHMIDGGFRTASSASVPGADITLASTPSVDAYLPQAKLGRGNYIYVYSFQNTNYYGLSGVTSMPAAPWGYIISDASGAGSLTVQEASNVDRKVDDGMPLTGTVRAQFVNCCDNSGDFAGSTTVVYGGASGGPASVAQWQWNTGANGSCFDNNGVAGVPPQYSLSQNGNGLYCELSFLFQ